MEETDESDLISEMPQSIIENILMKLPIVEAVKTSILSTRWRWKWASLTHLVFDDRSLTMLGGGIIVVDRILNFVTKCLFLHDGSIHTFSVSSSYLKTHTDIDQWLLFISRKDVRGLVVELGENEWFKAPSCLFSCKNLSRLEFTRCILEPPPSFKGFSCLKYLYIYRSLASSNKIENLISNCPLLESLTLWYFDCSAIDGIELAIRSQSLKYLTIRGELKNLYMAHTPLLVDISVSMFNLDAIAEYPKRGTTCNFDKFLGPLQKLERLTGHSYFVKYLMMGRGLNCNKGLKCSELTFDRLKFINLNQVGFDDIESILVVFNLILRSPHLKVLHVSSTSYPTEPNLEFWDLVISKAPMLNELKIVRLTDLCGLPHERKFIEFLLRHSPFLEEMSITPSEYFTEGRMDFLIDVLSFKRASPQASIRYIHRDDAPDEAYDYEEAIRSSRTSFSSCSSCNSHVCFI